MTAPLNSTVLVISLLTHLN